MRSWEIGAAVGALVVLGCGGVSQRDELHDAPSIIAGSGGDGGAFDGGSGGNPGAAGTHPVGEVGASGSAGSPCSNHPVLCDATTTYVDISDATTERLAYSTDGSSGARRDTCQIFATGTSNCGFINLNLSACSAPD